MTSFTVTGIPCRGPRSGAGSPSRASASASASSAPQRGHRPERGGAAGRREGLLDALARGGRAVLPCSGRGGRREQAGRGEPRRVDHRPQGLGGPVRGQDVARAVERLLRRAARRRSHAAAPSASSTACDEETAPNTPPCIVTIRSAASWLARSVAPVQSSRIRHS